ncbi:3-deoxy-D-manno-octulosonic acid kinase [Frateuria aurantia]
MIEVKSLQHGQAAALYDAQRAQGFVDDWLAGGGRAADRRRLLGGRGEVELIAPLGEPWVSRHYRRGGWMAKLFKDGYLWTGAEQTRCFREFRLLVELVGAGLPVAPPVAARYQRQGLVYRADLVTVQLPAARTLAEYVRAGAFDAALAAAAGRLIAGFHRAGIWHADLNAHNILRSDGRLYLIDFDRGERRTPARSWQTANLQRLQRSLRKLGAGQGQPAAWDALWQTLQAAYAEEMPQ